MTTETELDSRMRAAFEGNFLDASDIMRSGNITLEIAGVTAPNDDKDATGKSIDKSILAFKGAKKRLILNKINLKIVASMLGNTASKWIGQKITLTVRYLDKAFGQRNVPVIRVVPDDMAKLTFGMRKNYGAEKPYA